MEDSHSITSLIHTVLKMFSFNTITNEKKENNFVCNLYSSVIEQHSKQIFNAYMYMHVCIPSHSLKQLHLTSKYNDTFVYVYIFLSFLVHRFKRLGYVQGFTAVDRKGTILVNR